MQVYVLDDQSDICEIVSAHLTGAGYQCASFTEVPAFLAAISKEMPGLVICDISMPGMDGIELRNLLVQSQLTKGCGFIFLTARSDSEYRTRAWQAQADGYLTKPFTRNELIALVNNVASRIITQGQAQLKADHIYVSEGISTRRVRFSEISYVTVIGDYTVIYTSTGQIRTFTRLTDLEISLPHEAFVRIHKSYIVAIGQIDRINRTTVTLIDKTELPVGDKYRIHLEKLIESNRLQGLS